MVYANAIFLAASFLLEALLVFTLFGRHLARRLAIFVVLLCLYAVRETVLFGTARHISRLAYAQMETAFAAADLALQLALAAVLFLRISRQDIQELKQKSRMHGPMLLAIGAFLASLLTMVLMQFSPSYSPVPVDRGIVLGGCLFLVLFAFSAAKARPSDERLLLRGFALLAVCQIASQFGRATAAAHRQPALFLTWAYLHVAAWLVLLLVWLLNFRRREPAMR